MRARLALFAVCLLSLAALDAPAAAGPRGGSDTHGEVMIGGYSCGGDDEDVSSWVTFTTSGDIFEGYQSVYQQFGSDGDPGRVCDAAADTMRNVLSRESGCTTGPLRARSDGSGSSRSFDYVCHASRDAIVALIARASATLIQLGQ